MKGIYIALLCCFCKLLFQPSAPLLQSKPPPIFQTVHCIIIRGYVLIEKTKKTEQSEKKMFIIFSCHRCGSSTYFDECQENQFEVNSKQESPVGRDFAQKERFIVLDSKLESYNREGLNSLLFGLAACPQGKSWLYL